MSTTQTAPPTDSSETRDGSTQESSGNSDTGQKVKKFPVIEIFGPVIQGEGSQAGQQTMFIRFGGCDYRCTKCDSLHAVIPQAIQKHATYMTAEEIRSKLRHANAETGVNWITFSGGNPCMHKLDDLVNSLIHDGFYINVETQGTLWQDWLYYCSMITVSPKSLGMGEKFEEVKFRNFLRKLNGVRPLCVKVVVFSAVDLEYALHIQSIVKEESYNWVYEARLGIAYYLSLGNPYPPILNEELELVDNPKLQGALQDTITTESQTTRLLRSYRQLCEEILPDPRLKEFRFLPQLHVLVYGNETGR